MSSSVFSRFAPQLQEAIASRLGWTTLRPVQELARTVVGGAHYGGGILPAPEGLELASSEEGGLVELGHGSTVRRRAAGRAPVR